MKKHFLKSFALLAMLFSAITLSAQSGVDWGSITTWLGNGTPDAANTNNWKYYTPDGVSVVNVQMNDGKACIYAHIPEIITTCNVNDYKLSGAAIFLFLGSFTEQETKVVLEHNSGERILWIYNANGTPNGSTESELPDTEAPILENVELFGAAQNFVLLTPTASDNKKVTAYLITPNGGAGTETTLDDAGKIKISGLTMNTSYTYSVQAKDAAGNVSAAKKITFSTLDNVFCEEEVLPTNFFTKNQKLTLTAKKITTTKTLIELTSTTSTLTGVQNYNITNGGGGAISAQTDWTVANNTLSKTITWATYPTNPITMFVTALRTPGASESNMIEFNYTIDVSNTCGGVIEENPTITTTPAYSACTGDNYSYVYTNDNAGNVHLSVTFNQAIEGVNGPQFYTDNNVALAATTPDNRNFYVSVSDKNDGDIVKLKAHIPRTGGLTTTPLLTHTVGQVTNDIITTEYNNYTDATMTKNGASVAFTWETATNGDIVVTMSNGAGATSCSFRSGGFEGGIETFVVSTDNFTTTLPASDYFTYTPVSSGNEARFVKKADLPKGAKIKFVGEGGGKALCWKVNDTDQYEWVKFIYTYGSVSNKLAAPTNVAVTDAGAITFDAVAGADSYEVYVYQGEELKHSQDITSGGTIEYVDYVANVYTVNVIAKATCKVNSEKSASVTWNKPVSPLPASNYCEKQADRITANHGACNPLFTWTTDNAGNVVITISASEGNAGETKFRIENGTKQGMNGIFKLNGSEADFNTYFNKGITDEYTYTLTLNNAANKPTPGSVISFSGQIEAKSSIHNDDWSDYEFDGYLYGTKCDGPKRVTVSINDAAMGTAKVNGQDEVYVDPDKEATFTATPNDGYVFVNWTKGNEVVSTSPTYTTTITSALSLVANFDYIRTIYCQQEVLTNAGRKVYLTVGQAPTAGKYQIKIEGSTEVKITGIFNTNVAMNNIKFTDKDGVTHDGNDVNLLHTNGGWTFSDEGYGIITSAEIEPSTGKTWKDMWIWRPGVTFKTEGNPDIQNIDEILVKPNHFDWSNICEADTEKPVIGSAQLISTTYNTVIIQVSATDNKEIAAYHIVDAANAIDKNIAATDGTITIAGLKHSTTYQFSITAIDKSANESANSATITATTNQISYCDLLTGNGGDENYADINGRCLLTISKLTGNNLRVTVEKTAESANLDFLYVVAGGATPYPAIAGENGKTEGGEQSLSVDLNYTTLTFPIAIEVKWSTVGVPGEYLVNCTDILEAYLCQDLADKTAPVMGSATLATVSHNNAIINVEATDNEKVAKYRVVYGTSTIEVEPIDNQIVVNGLQESTSYIFTIYAIDAAGNVSANSVQVAATTAAYVDAPSSLPAAPTSPANQVKAVYSDTYNAGCDFGDWGSGTEYTPDTYGKKFVTTNLGYFGLTGFNLNCSKMETLHMDIWCANTTTLGIVPIYKEGQGVDEDKRVTKRISGGQWNSVDIPLTDFVEVPTWDNIHQIKIDNVPNQTLWLNNIYFYTNVTPTIVDENTDLTSLTPGICDLTLIRNFVMDGDWNTICLPFALDEDQVKEVFGEGTQLTKLSSSALISSTKVEILFESVTSMEAATPYLIKPKKNVNEGVFLENVTINTTPNILEAGITKMIPVLKTQVFTGEDNSFFLGANETLYKQSTSGKIMAMRAYFQFSTLTPEQLRNVRARVVFNENTETNVDNITIDKAPIKVIQNGQLIIIRNGVKYNVQGQKL